MSTPPSSSVSYVETENEYYCRQFQTILEITAWDNAEQDTGLYEAQQTEQAVQDPGSMDESPDDESPEDPTLFGALGSPLFSLPPTPPPSQPALALPVTPPPVVTELVIPEVPTLLGSTPNPLPSPLPSQPAPVLPIPAPPVVTGDTEPQTTAPPFNEESRRPKQSRAPAKRVPKQQAPKRANKRVAKPSKPLSANKLQK
ncbi:hypothetical protein FMUND_12079, partial [Fusarium mundagurra]